MTVLDPTTGFPSVGRLRCTLEEVKAEFVEEPQFAQSKTRQAVWDDFETALALLGGAVKVHAVWLAGSFISSKVDPNDIDAVFVVNWVDWMNRPPADAAVIATFLNRIPDATGAPAPAHGLKVDSYLIPWAPIPIIDWQNDGNHRLYAASRGYWDDFWCRTRTGAKTDPLTERDALPVRGYLEVIVDDFTC